MTRTAYELARMAECAGPDAPDSPGAKFLVGVEEDYLEARGDGYDEDTAHEIADGAVPVYTHEMWLTFVDLCAYNEDPSELGGDHDDMTKAGAACLYIIAARLVNALHEADDGEEDEDEDDDDDDAALTPVPGAEPRYDDDGREIVDVMTCGTCGRSWNDAAVSSVTPVPSGRCPFEYMHDYSEMED